MNETKYLRIAISAESTIDLSNRLIEKYDIKTVPFTVTLGDQTAFDGVITSKEIITYCNEHKTLPKTSAVNEYQYQEHFSKLLKEYDAVIHFCLSSEISSAYQNACLAKEEFDNVWVIDSRALSTGIALEAIYACKLVQKGYSPEKIIDYVTSRIPSIQTSFVINRLDYLYRGGRCNAIQLLSATLLKIRQQIIMQDGKLIAKKKYRGNMDKCIIKYVEDTLEEFNTPDLEEIFITSTTANPEQLIAVKDILQKRGFKNINITYAGATITSHCGENCLGILYLNDGDENGEHKEL